MDKACGPELCSLCPISDGLQGEFCPWIIYTILRKTRKHGSDLGQVYNRGHILFIQLSLYLGDERISYLKDLIISLIDHLFLNLLLSHNSSKYSYSPK